MTNININTITITVGYNGMFIKNSKKTQNNNNLVKTMENYETI